MDDALQRANTALRNEDWSAAASWLELHLSDHPDDHAARAWLGQCRCSIGQRASGIEALREAGLHLAESGDHVTTLIELATELQHWRDPEGALSLLEMAVQTDLSNEQAHHLLAITNAQLNRLPEALHSIEQARGISPQNKETLLLQASLMADAGHYREAGECLEQLLSKGLEPSLAYRTHKEFARVLDKQHIYDGVFAHLHKASNIAAFVPEFRGFDRRALPAMIESNRSGFDLTLIGKWCGADFTDPAPVFIIGFLRSGTTLTQEVLATHPDAFVSDEVDFVMQTIREMHRRDPSRSSTAEKLKKLDHAGIAALRRFYWDAVKNYFGEEACAPVFIDKFTTNTVDIGFINTIFPDGRLVFVLRDPRDVCLSCFQQLMMPSLTTVQLHSWQGTARFYAQVMAWWLHIRPFLTMEVHEFRYEDAVVDFEATFRAVFSFAGLPWNPSAIDFHRRVPGKFVASPSRNQVAQPLYRSSAGRWQHYAREYAPVAGLLGPAISRLGYPPFDQ